MYDSHVLHGQLLLSYYVTDANVAGGVAAGGLVVAVYALLLGVGAWRVHLRGRLCVYTNRSLNDLASQSHGWDLRKERYFIALGLASFMVVYLVLFLYVYRNWPGFLPLPAVSAVFVTFNMIPLVIVTFREHRSA